MKLIDDRDAIALIASVFVIGAVVGYWLATIVAATWRMP